MRSGNDSVKVLGMGYDMKRDVLYVRVTEKAKMPVETKRQMLSLVHSVYDPLGIASAYVFKGREFFQRANELDLGWDDRLPDSLLKEFKVWQDSMFDLRKIKGDLFLKDFQNFILHLHLFSSFI